MNFLNKYKAALVSLLLVITTIAVYGQVHEFEFVNYDDTIYVAENSNIQKGISINSLAWAFTTVHAANWHPITWLSHMLDCRFFGMHPGNHHLTNLFLHIANILLLFFVFRKMTGGLWQSAFMAALLALHPLNVESVAWMSERKNVLSTFFWMLTMGCYAAYVFRPSISRYFGMLVFFVFGLMSKPMLVTLPCVLLLLDYWPLERFSFQESSGNHSQNNPSILKLLWEKIPLFALVIISCGLTYYAQKHGGAVKSLDYIPFADRVTNALVSYVLYIGKMMYPVKLACLYPHPGTLAWWKVLTAGLFLLMVSALAIRTAKTHPYFMVGWLWYLGTLVPVIGLVQVGAQSMADRYTYIPLIGLFIMFVWGLPEILKQWRLQKVFMGAFSIVLIVILTGLTWKQAGYWKNSTTLFEHALTVTDNNSTIHYNLGNVLAEKGQDREAMNHYVQALQVKPDFADAHNNLANLYAQQGNPDAAIEHYLKVLVINPDYEGARYNLGIALDSQGRTEEAVPHFFAALKDMPDNADAFFKTGNVLFKSGDIDSAIKYYQQALQIKPDFVDAHCNLGVALFRKGDVDGSVAAFKAALRLQPDFKAAQQYLQKALMVRSNN
ncbi:MAG: tetratricopeptide repeat protein [Desulfobacteraceae bacterium]|nr:tetratricopeptide repeat protein [Desulfobacteraceae bacterium]MBC2757885.1 tetratricopeptide repeat protein [Desulfobacteraceae bacterium]